MIGLVRMHQHNKLQLRYVKQRQHGLQKRFFSSQDGTTLGRGAMRNNLLLKFRGQNSIYHLIFHHKYLVNYGKIR